MSSFWTFSTIMLLIPHLLKICMAFFLDGILMLNVQWHLKNALWWRSWNQCHVWKYVILFIILSIESQVSSIQCLSVRKLWLLFFIEYSHPVYTLNSVTYLFVLKSYPVKLMSNVLKMSSAVEMHDHWYIHYHWVHIKSTWPLASQICSGQYWLYRKMGVTCWVVLHFTC